MVSPHPGGCTRPSRCRPSASEAPSLDASPRREPQAGVPLVRQDCCERAPGARKTEERSASPRRLCTTLRAPGGPSVGLRHDDPHR